MDIQIPNCTGKMYMKDIFNISFNSYSAVYIKIFNTHIVLGNVYEGYIFDSCFNINSAVHMDIQNTTMKMTRII